MAKIFKAGNLNYVCKCGRWRDGFTHKVEIQNQFGETLIKSCTKYYNRTWEAYGYQCAMRRAQESLIRKIHRARVDFEKYDFEKEPEIIRYC